MTDNKIVLKVNLNINMQLLHHNKMDILFIELDYLLKKKRYNGGGQFVQKDAIEYAANKTQQHYWKDNIQMKNNNI